MNKVAIVIYWLVMVAPTSIYLLVNFYWWLFDGNVLIQEKMVTTLCVNIITVVVGVMFTMEYWD